MPGGLIRVGWDEPMVWRRQRSGRLTKRLPAAMHYGDTQRSLFAGPRVRTQDGTLGIGHHPIT